MKCKQTDRWVQFLFQIENQWTISIQKAVFIKLKHSKNCNIVKWYYYNLK